MFIRVQCVERELLPRKAGGAQDWPQATWTRFMMKKGAQHTMKAENTWDKM